MLMLLFTGLLIAGVVGYLTRSRPAPATAYADSRPGDRTGYQPNRTGQPGYQLVGGADPRYSVLDRLDGRADPRYSVLDRLDTRGDRYSVLDRLAGRRTAPDPDPALSEQDAEAEARHWVDRLGSGIGRLDGGENTSAVQSLSEAAERHGSARRQLAEARSVMEFALAGRTAREGLHYLRAARTALGLDPGPSIDDDLEGIPGIQGPRRVVVENREYEASAEPGDRTPYYYPGGTVRGRTVPSGWYSTPWWKTALIAGAAGVGSMLVLDALLDGFGGLGHHAGGVLGGGLFDGPGPDGFGGFDGGPGGFDTFGDFF